MSQDTEQPQQQKKEQQAEPQDQAKDQSKPEQQPEQKEQQQQQVDKSTDKKEIADEEREKMLNAENTKHSGSAPAPELEAEEHKPKRKIPIGAIKMPGFCRSKSKEPCKDEESKPIENNDGEAKDGEATDKGTPTKEGGRKGLLQAIRLPLSSVFSRKKKENDAELGVTGAAGLASVETLDDAAAQEKNNAALGDDGMETVRLDAEAGDGQPVKPHPLAVFLVAARRNIVASAATLFILLLVVIIICVACFDSRRIIVQPVIDGKITTQTSCGPVEGLAEDDAYAFRGIPYAMPPVNERRWMPSEPLNSLNDCWNGTFKAHNSSQMCWQRNGTQINGHEDCLYLDVFTPKVTQENLLSVVVMIGADTLSGPSPGVLIPAGKFARVRDLVLVRPNFRLDVFGFLAVEPLTRASHPPSSGNYALHDIINVLKWVQLNIDKFGGDKKKVMLWGHRAGGTLVTSLIKKQKEDDNLFDRVWISSGSAIYPMRELSESEKLNEPFLTAINCRDAACLKSKKAEDIMEAVPASWYAANDGLPDKKEENAQKHQWLVKDGIIIQQHIGEILSKESKLPKIVMGTTAQSGQLPKFLKYNTTEDPKQIEKLVADSLIGAKGYTEKAFAQYNKTIKGLHTMISDIRVVCPLMTVSRMNNSIPFYIATFPRGFISDVDNDAAAILGFFPNVTATQKRHLQAIQQLFNHFAWNGEVVHTQSGKKILIVDQDVLPMNNYDNCDLWIKDNIVPQYARVD